MTKAGMGLFIVLEGIDGAGKTTIAKMLLDDLERNGYRTIYTFEPWTTRFVEDLKSLGMRRDAYIDALIYAADRLVHVKEVIEPAIRDGYIVVCDRYFYSSVAYQSAMGVPMDWIITLNMFALKPDLAIYLDVEPEIGIARKRGYKSRFPEYEEYGILRKAREIYLEMVRRNMLVYIYAGRDIGDVYRDVRNIVYRAIEQSYRR
ncbi:thymidylate kinase [Ignisphaera aggregans DSM 17230]|uniref:Probable thymidylate kinase n=1 Tax=Ignisphaera aggregans (strain DSM 17230 / JCM 13409 / AQ1.S1) TaxID=583356 RepID=E0SNT8_IGNAA|nr:thymidylate kinase [Ignisphaera aggregans DSM 17230]